MNIDCKVNLFTETKRPTSIQECFRVSNWFFLQCFGAMDHLPPVWWSNVRFMFETKVVVYVWHSREAFSIDV